MKPAEGARILVVDDDAYVREALREHLEHAGFLVLEAADGKVASDLLDREPVDLVLLDLELPRVSGLELLAHMVDDHAEVAVLIVSGKGSVARAVDTMKLGAFDFLEKPVEPAGPGVRAPGARGVRPQERRGPRYVRALRDDR